MDLRFTIGSVTFHYYTTTTEDGTVPNLTIENFESKTFIRLEGIEIPAFIDFANMLKLGQR